MIITPREIFDFILATVVVGYIFTEIFRYIPLPTEHMSKGRIFLISTIISGPAIIFHEAAHKFVGLAYGVEAVFHAAYTFLGIGVILKAIHSKFIFFVPGFVALTCPGGVCPITSFQSAIIAVVGPATNLLLFFIAWGLLRQKKYHFRKEVLLVIYLTKQINLLLFILNMLPIPIFDGFKFYSGMYQTFF